MSKRILYNISSANLQATNISGGTISGTIFTGGNLNLSGNLNVANSALFSEKVLINNTITTRGNYIYGTNGNSFTSNVLTNLNRLRVSRVVANSCVSSNSWINYTSVNTQIRSICWSPELNLFVATGVDGSAVLTSPDGINWTSRAISQNNQWNCVIWSPELSLFVAGAGNGTNRIMTSSDGITWTMQNITTNTYFGICWCPELLIFVVVGSTVRYSSDGINWSSDGSIPAGTWNSVCWSPELNLFVAVNTTGGIATSTDGRTFTSRTSPTANSLKSVCWSPELNLFVVVSETASSTAVVTSSDGITWTLRTTPVYQWHSVVWSPYLSIFFSVGLGGAMMSSSDGFTWTQITDITGSADNRSICWSPELNVFVFGHSSSSSNIWRSTPPQVNTGDLNAYGNLRIGESTQGNYIEFSGTSNDATYTGHTYIGERIYSSGTEKSELLLFKGNDISGAPGPDRIRLLAANHVFDTYTSALSGTFEGVGTSGTTRMLIDQNGNVGVGTTSPTYTLDVAGTGRFTNKLTFTGSLASTGLDLATNDNYAEMRVIRNSTFSSDKDMYLQWAAGANSKIFLLSNNTQTMALNGGNVGIGNTNPGQKLDVTGTTLNRNGNAVGGFSENQQLFGWSGSTTGTYMHAIKTRHNAGANDINNALDFYVWQTSDAVTSGGTKHVMSATSVGVGINTTSPSYTLHVNGDIALPHGNVIRATGVANTKVIETTWQNSQDQLIFYTPGANNGNAKLCIQHDGNVGIGTTAPAAEIHILESTGNNSNPANIFLDKNGERSSIQTWTYNNSRSNLFIGSNAYVTNAGNLILNNTSASRGWMLSMGTNLDAFEINRVVGTNAAFSYFSMTSSGSTLISVLPGVDQANNIRIGRNDSPTIRYHDLEFQTSVTQASSYMSIKLHNGTTTTSQAEVMRIRADGRVGINATAPVSNLCINTNDAGGNGVLQVLSLPNTVNGGKSQDGAVFRAWNDDNNILQFFNAAGVLRGAIDGVNASSVSYNTTSDKRLKENVTDLSNSIDIIKRMRPVEFTWKTDNKRDFGFIAQEIYQVLPEMRPNLSSYSHCECNTTDISNGILCNCEDYDHEEPLDKDGKPLYYGLDYGKITPYLTKALQETINEVENLKQYCENFKLDFDEYKKTHP